MSIKLLVTDIDETLVHMTGPVSKANLEAIEAARAEGVYVTLATGRGYYGALRVIEQLGLDTYIINYGGAMIVDSKTGEPVFMTELDNEYVQEIMKMAREMDLHAHLYQGDCIVYEKPHTYADRYVAALNLPHKLDPDLASKVWTAVPKVLVITEPERVSELLPMFQAHFKGRVSVSASSPGFIEFNRLGANKGTAVEFLAKTLGVEREDVACIGDNTLDYEMIEYAGVGAVVENGNEKLKSIADLILPPCTEDAVAYFINNYVLDGSKHAESRPDVQEERKNLRLGFDIGGTNVVCGLFDENLALLAKASRPFRKNRDGGEEGSAETIADDLFDLAAALLEENGLDADSVSSVGVCIPGSINTEQGVVTDAHNLGLHDSPFRSVVAERFGKPCVLLNDADAAAYAEHRFGALKKAQNAMLVTIGTGIGVGIILDGKLFHGGRGFGVEAGHVQMDMHGERCTCGRRGCIETLCSASWLTRQASELKAGAEGETLELYDRVAEGGAFDAKALIEAAKLGDEACMSIFDRYLNNLANALASYINILDPELIAIGGGVSGAGDFLILPLIMRTAKQSFFREPTMIVRAELGNDAGLVGAAAFQEK